MSHTRLRYTTYGSSPKSVVEVEEFSYSDLRFEVGAVNPRFI